MSPMEFLIVFAVHAANPDHFDHAVILAESIRMYGGSFADAPVWIYTPEKHHPAAVKKIASKKISNVELKISNTPDDFSSIPFSGKVFAAARAEMEASQCASILVWMDEDTVILNEPLEFNLKNATQLAYRPVMHRNIAPLFSEPLDEYWSRIYEVMQISDRSVFPVKTVAGEEYIRPYINAGLLVVNPRKGLLTAWANSFSLISRDEKLEALCKENQLRKIFLHQAVLSGCIMNLLDHDEIYELPDSYNYPLFFDRLFESEKVFDSIETAVSIRYDVFFDVPVHEWYKLIKGSQGKIDWLKSRFLRKIEINPDPYSKFGFVDVPGTQLFYEEKGQGKPVIFIHGGGIDRRLWDPQWETFSTKYRVIRYDVRGHGASQSERVPFSDSEDLLAVCRHLNVDRCVLVGLSLGGSIAIEFTLSYPERVEALLLAGSGLNGYQFESPEVKDFSTKIRRVLAEGDFDAAFECFLRAWTDGPKRTPDQVDPEVRAKAAEMMQGGKNRMFIARLENQLDPPAITRLSEIRCPVLFISGDLDMPDIHNISEIMSQSIPNFRQECIQDAAHLVNLEKPEQFNSSMMEFLEQISK